MRYRDLKESTEGAVIVYHGSSNPEIETFRFDNLRHRTGTPGTLSFSTKIKTSAIYGKTIYECEVKGWFGDYEDPEDCQLNYDWRWPKHIEWLEKRGCSQEVLDEAPRRLMDEIQSGAYNMWENIGLWAKTRWDGAWCYESGAKNLIVGKDAEIKILRKFAAPNIPGLNN
jgi:hypothetical protein